MRFSECNVEGNRVQTDAGSKETAEMLKDMWFPEWSAAGKEA